MLREEEVKEDVFRGWKARAEMSVTAYTLDDADLTTRPITFVFNGGPGSSSIWLHMGLLGPRRVDMGDVTAPHPPPYRLVDNAETLLAASDLVFIDPMSTGHTRAVEGGKAKEYHGFAKDVEQVTELIRLWCTREDRWMSPKFIVGESYGTVRAVAVAERLQETHALTLNGLVLVSSVLDFGTQDFGQHRWDESCLNFLPTYTAIAHYHGKLKGRLTKVRQEAEAFAAGPYRTALAAGRRLPSKERAGVVRTLARLTGLSEEYVERTDLRIEHWRFCTELLRDRGLTCRPHRRPVHRPGEVADRGEHGRRPVDGRDERHRSQRPCTTTCAASSATPRTCRTRSTPPRSRSGRTRSSRASRSSSPTSSSG